MVRIMGRGILSKEIMVFFIKAKSALLLARKKESIIAARDQLREKNINARINAILFCIKLVRGDHKSRPAMNMPDTARFTMPIIVKQELINCCGLSDLARNRTIVILNPSMLISDNRRTDDIIAEPTPTSYSV